METPLKVDVVSKTRVVVRAENSGPSANGLEGGCYHRVAHPSSSTGTKMIFGLFIPSTYSLNAASIPALFWLSGLTCDDTNFPIKAGSKAFEAAERHGIAVVMSDTSPRHDDEIPNVDSYDLGIGAGFYVDASASPYDQHYKMYAYITKELPEVLKQLNIGSKKSISGHSMGGHGALTIALREGPRVWSSVSAFAPICNPTDCPWGIKAFTNYFGSTEAGTEHDAVCLLNKKGASIFDDILIDQGTSDQFLKEQLKPETLVQVAKKVGQKVTLNMREGFDHSYHFIGAFIDSHIDFHAKFLTS